jgi:tetratricopeptide (TPR) repeat protein/O-antigen ligase
VSSPVFALPLARPPRLLFWLLAAIHVVCPLLFFTDLTRNPYYTQIALLNAGLAAGVGFWAAASLSRGSFALVRTPLDGPLAAFLAVALASWAASWAAHPTFRLSIRNEGTRAALFLAVNALAAFFLAAQLLDPAWDKRFRRLALAVGALAGGYGILQYAGREIFWPQAINPYSGRPVSTFGNPNFLSSYLVMLLPLCLVELVQAATPRAKAFFSGLFLLFSAALICTFTRSSWIGAAVATGTLLWLGRGRLAPARRWIAGVLLATFLLAAFWPSSPLAAKSTRPLDRVTELIQGVTQDQPYGSWHQRLLIWSCALDMTRERPVLGKGWGCFELFYPFYQGWYLSDSLFRNFRTHANNAHQLLLEFWSQTGFAGLGVILWIGLLTVELARRRIPALPDDARLPALALLAAGAGMAADNFFGNVSLFFAVPAFFFFWIFGTFARELSPGPARLYRARGPLGWTVGVVLVLGSLAVVKRSYDHWKAEILYFDGFKKAKQGDIRAAVAALEKSHAYRRWEVNNNYELGNAYARQARWAGDNDLSGLSKEFIQKAVWAYDEAVAANAGYDEIYFNRAALLSQVGRKEDAALSYRMALLINPLSSDAYRALGHLYLTDLKSEDRAVDLFERAVFFFPRDKESWNNLGYLYTRLNQDQQAVDAFARALQIDFHFDVAWRNMQVSLRRLGREEHPLHRVPRLWKKAQEAAAKNQWPEARRHAEAVVALAPESVLAKLALADVCARMNDDAAAAAGYEKILEWEPGHWEARLNLGKIHARQGRRLQARALFEALAAERPQDQEVAALLRSVGGQVP